MAEIAATACRRCREQKLRCSRELPHCERCVRLSATCTYPKPPDRKLIASMRAPPRKRQRKSAEVPSDSASANSTRQPRELSSDSIAPAAAREPSSEPETLFEANSDELEFELPSKDVQELLQDLYFTCAFNSSLTIHQPSFIKLWKEDKLPLPLLLSVCALGTNFLGSTSVMAKYTALRIPPVSELKASAKRWVVWAGGQTLQHMDQPTLSGIQTCQVLSLYWFAVGEAMRNTMLSGISYRASRILIPDVKGSGLGEDNSGHPRQTPSEWIEAETLRRCFWAAWIQYCVNADHYIVGSSLDTRLLNIPLPASESQFHEGVPEPEVTLASTQDLLPMASPIPELKSISLRAELVKMVLNWARVRDNIESRPRQSTQDCLASLFDMDQKLSDVKSNLPPSVAYSKRNLYEQLVVKQQPAYSVIHAMLHQCRLVLHASLVPQFSGLPMQKKIPLEAVRISARIAWEAAQAISELGADLLALEWDLAQTAPFLGYCLYVSSTIHMAFISSRNNALATTARSSLLSNLKLLKVMKMYWKIFEKLWTRIHLLYEVQTTGQSPFTNELSPWSPGSNDLDQVAMVKRETSQLAEPLADSVLQYTLRRLKKNITDKDVARSIRELETAVTEDHMAKLTNEIAPNAQQLSTGSTQSPDQIPVITDPLSSLVFTNPSQSISQNLLSDINTNWWDTNTEMFPPGMLSYDDLFGGELNL